MPLILAIEPNRQQASQLAAVLRGRLDAELVIAESAEGALTELGDRVPDVLLTSPLLSSQDEAMLAERLRELGAAAAHVQTLTIPILAASTPRPAPSRGGRVLSMLRRRRQAVSTPDGCDPTVFAEQIALYLQRTTAERGVEVSSVPVVESEPLAVPEVLFAAPLAPDDDTQWVEVPLETLEEPARWIVASQPEEPLQTEEVWELPPMADVDNVIVTCNPQPTAPEPEAKTTVIRRKAKSPQDEWGLFDPNQCGFAALVDKLDEITHDATQTRGEVSVRVISYS